MLDGFDRDNTILHQDWDARFDNRTDDVSLIETVAADEPMPVWFTADVRQRTSPDERKALGSSGMTAVFLRGGFHDLTPHNQARLLINVWPNVVLQCRTCREPTIFEIGNRVTTMKVDRVCLTRELIVPRKKKR